MYIQRLFSLFIPVLCTAASIPLHDASSPGGIAPRSPISGGQTIDFDEAPFMAVLETRDSKFFCGATLISHKIGVTSKSCIRKLQAADFGIRVGAMRFEGPRMLHKGKVSGIASIKLHPSADIAVLVLRHRIPETRAWNGNGKIAYAVLPSVQRSPLETEVLAYGWGQTSQVTNSQPQQLMKVKMSVSTSSACEGFRVRQNLPIASSYQNFCTIPDKFGKGTCVGDAGGPVVSSHDSTLVGIISGVAPCGSTTIPTFVVRVGDPAILRFIEEVKRQYP